MTVAVGIMESVELAVWEGSGTEPVTEVAVDFGGVEDASVEGGIESLDDVAVLVSCVIDDEDEDWRVSEGSEERVDEEVNVELVVSGALGETCALATRPGWKNRCYVSLVPPLHRLKRGYNVRLRTTRVHKGRRSSIRGVLVAEEGPKRDAPARGYNNYRTVV